MNLYVVFGLRPEGYEGEYGPEALAVVDDFTYDENPKWIRFQAKKAEESKEFSAVGLFRIRGVDADIIRESLVGVTDLAQAGVEVVDPTTEGGE